MLHGLTVAKKKKNLLETRLSKRFETLEQVRKRGGICRICLLVSKKNVVLILFSGEISRGLRRINCLKVFWH